MDIPRKPTDSDAEGAFHQRTHEELHSGKNDIVASSDIRVQKTTRGRVVSIRQGTRGFGGQIPVWL